MLISRRDLNVLIKIYLLIHFFQNLSDYADSRFKKYISLTGYFEIQILLNANEFYLTVKIIQLPAELQIEIGVRNLNVN